MTKKTILLANPRGFCAGVDRAISIVERALEQFGAPIYVRHHFHAMRCRARRAAKYPLTLHYV